MINTEATFVKIVVIQIILFKSFIFKKNAVFIGN